MPGGITLKESAPADIPTPDTGKDTIFIDSGTSLPSYKDDAGVTHTLVGADGATGAAGPVGSAGFGFDGEDGDPPIIAGLPGATGQTGLTGSQGPVGPVMVISDGIDGEDGISVQGPVGIVPVVSEFDIQVILTNITDAEFRALNTVPKLIAITAPGTRKIIVPIRFQYLADITGVFSANPTLNVRPVGGTSTHFAAVAIAATATGQKTSSTIPAALQTAIVLTTTGQINTQWEIFGSISATGGTTNNGFNFYLWYVILTLP